VLARGAEIYCLFVIGSVEKRLVDEVRKNDTLIIVGETGSGKTTRKFASDPPPTPTPFFLQLLLEAVAFRCFKFLVWICSDPNVTVLGINF